MKQFLLIAIALLLCIVPASAFFDPGTQEGFNNTEYDYFPFGIYNSTDTLVSPVNDAGADAFCAAIGQGSNLFDAAIRNTFTASNQNTGPATAFALSGTPTTWAASTYNYSAFGIKCSDNNYHWAKVWYKFGSEPIAIADFTATPISGPASLYVQFDDTSSNASIYNWSITPITGVIGYLGSTRNHSASFTLPGNYTVNHCVSNAISSDCEEKTDYITVYNATSDYTTTGFAAMDKPRWAQLAGATINLYDVANGSWKNTSSSTTGYEEITTIANGTINAYASLAGYGDVQLLSKPAWNGGTYTLEMLPIGYANVTAGNITLYVSTWGSDVTSKMSGVTVNLAYLLGGSQYSDYRVTGAAGISEFVVPNQTTIYIYAAKAGYAPGGTTVSSGTGNGGNASVYADITLQRQYVTTAPTQTTLPGGGTPTTTVTVDPRTSAEKQEDMANILLDYGDELVLFFIVLTIVGGVKLIGK